MLRGGREAARMIPCGDIHHLRLTVTDVQRSREFYTGLLGFQVAVESPPPGDPAAAETFNVLFGGVDHDPRQPDHGAAADGPRG